MLIHDLIGFFSHELAVDLGTSRTRLHCRDLDDAVESPTKVGIRTDMRRNVTEADIFGEAALRLVGRTPPGIEVTSPVRRGVVADVPAAGALLANMIERLHGRSWAVKPDVVASCPAGSTPAERDALIGAMTAAGVRKCCLIDNLTAALAGSTRDPGGNAHIVVDLGAGKINFGAVRISGECHSASVGFGGDELAEALARALTGECSIEITASTAQGLLSRVGLPDASESADGTGLPSRLEDLMPVHVAAMLGSYLDQLTDAMREMIRTAPRLEGSGEMEAEVILTGGLARMPGLAGWISAALGLPVRLPPEPERAVVRGLKLLAEQVEARSQWVTA